MLVHSVMVESNHFHMVITDVRGELSRFMCWLDARTAKCLIAHYEKVYPDEYLAEIWSKDKYNAVVLPNANAVIQAITYDATNPIKDRLVRDYREWPGLKSRPGDWMQPARFVKRPVGLAFSDRTKEHREVKVQYVVPPALGDRPIQPAVDDVHAMIRNTTRAVRSFRSKAARSSSPTRCAPSAGLIHHASLFPRESAFQRLPRGRQGSPPKALRTCARFVSATATASNASSPELATSCSQQVRI